MNRFPRPRLCIFDLDGTLVDSLRDIGESLNACLELLGLPGRALDEYRFMVGEGFPKLCERAIGATHPHLTPRLVELGAARYRTRPLQHTAPYAGIPELLARLRQAGIQLAVLSNKPHDMTVRIVRALWPDETFAQVQGSTCERTRKPHPHHLLALCRAAGVSPAQAWMVGDTATDMRTAHAAGAVAIGVTWGFRPRAELLGKDAPAAALIDAPGELVGLL